MTEPNFNSDQSTEVSSADLSCPSLSSARTFSHLGNIFSASLFCYLFLVLCFGSSYAATRDEKLREIEALIEGGSPIMAARKLEELASASSRTPEEMMVLARLERNGSLAAEFLTAALAGIEYPRQRERVYLSLARYYQALGNLNKLRTVLNQHAGEFSRSEFRGDFSILRVFLAEREGKFKRAKSICRELISSSSRSDIREWAQLTLARFELQEKSTHAKGRKSAFRVSIAQKSEMAPVALYLLAKDDTRGDAGSNGDSYDQAALDFNILREAYPHAIGSYDLIEIISEIDSRSDQGEAEKLIGSFYSIQVGVFTAKDNAKRQKKQFESYGEPVEISRKTISGKRYYAVYVGHFPSADAASSFKRTLERSEKDLFNIALRQK